MCVYVSKTCNCGPQLHSRKISNNMPDQFGPATIDKVLREAVQACIECANNERTVFNTVKDGAGKIVITGNFSDFIVNKF